MTVLDLSTLYSGQAKLADLPGYEQQALDLASDGQEVVLTGAAPIWMYLRIAHILHGKSRKLSYCSPVTGNVVIFDHNPF